MVKVTVSYSSKVENHSSGTLPVPLENSPLLGQQTVDRALGPGQKGALGEEGWRSAQPQPAP